MSRVPRLLRPIAAALLVLVGLGACIDIDIGLVADIRAFLENSQKEDHYHLPALTTGDELTIRLTEAKGSTVTFQLSLAGPGGAAVDLSAFQGLHSEPGALTLDAFPVPADGVYTFRVTASGPVEYRMKSRVGTAKKPVTKLDLRPKKFGITTRDLAYVSRRLGPDGGTLSYSAGITGDDLMTNAKVVVPQGALAATTDVSFVNTVAPVLDDPAGQRVLGPAMRVRPDNRPFAQPLTINVPIEAITPPPGFDAMNDVRVLFVGKDKKREVLVPTAATTTTVTVSSSSGGTFVAFIQRTSPRVGSRRYSELRLDVELVQAGNDDSRVRRIRASRASLLFEEAGTFGGNVAGAETELSHEDDTDAVLKTTEFTASETGTWTGDATTVDTLLTPVHVIRHVSDDGDLLVRGIGTGSGATAGVAIAIAQPAINTTFTSPAVLTGTYTIGGIEFGVIGNGQGPADFEILRLTGRLSLHVDTTQAGAGTASGTWVATVTEFVAHEASGDGKRKAVRRTVKLAGTFAPDTDAGRLGIVLTGAGLDAPIHVLVSPDGGEIAGLEQPLPAAEEPSALFFVGTRKAAVTVPAFDGLYAENDFGAALADYMIATAVVPDVAIVQTERKPRFDAPGVQESGFKRFAASRSASTVGGVLIATSVSAGTDVATNFALAKSGVLSLVGRADGRLVGAVSPSARFAFAVSTSTKADAGSVLALLVRSAPPP